MKEQLLHNAQQFVFEIFKNKLPKTYVYHNYLHTKRVVESTQELINHSELKEQDQLCLLLAAWFHDTGYIHGPEDHEVKSAQIAEKYLLEQNVSDTMIKDTIAYIKATKFNYVPTNLHEEIIKDADTSHLAKEYYKEVSELLRQEVHLVNNTVYTPAEWREENIKVFTERHKYYTYYAITNWEPKKNQHLISLLKKRKKRNKKLQKEKLKVKLKSKYKEESPERGIQTMFRVTLRNHIKLSDIADTKANILLSVNAIIISLALANLIPKLDAPSNKHLMIPSLILVLFSVVAIILSIMSTQPNVTGKEFTKEQIQNRKVNLLFFGNFYKMKYENYQEAIDQLISDKQYVYKMLTKDLYLLGIVLKRKYTLLKITYIVFTIGIILSVIAFIVAFTTI